MPDERKINSLLAEYEIDMPDVTVYEITDSTNTKAREYAKKQKGTRKTAVFIADGQSAGRGRRGRSFFSEKGAGIYMSFLIYPNHKGALATKLTAYTAVALSRALEKVTPLKPSIKWVNDIYASGKKLAGILAECEMSPDGEISYLVIGMGINVYKTKLPDEISSIATSIEDACECRVSREILIAEIIREFLENINLLDSDEIYDEYKKRLFILGESINVIRANETYTATAVDVTRDFELLVMREDGSFETLNSGEVSTKTQQP